MEKNSDTSSSPLSYTTSFPLHFPITQHYSLILKPNSSLSLFSSHTSLLSRFSSFFSNSPKPNFSSFTYPGTSNYFSSDIFTSTCVFGLPTGMRLKQKLRISSSLRMCIIHDGNACPLKLTLNQTHSR